MKLNIARKLMLIMMLTTGIVVGIMLGLLPYLHIFIASTIALVVAAAAAFALSRDLVRAINVLVDGTRKLTAGDFTTRITLDRTDELGQLAADFNSLATTLQKQDNAKKQWLTDTSHELRTPVAVLRAQVEAFQDGVQQPNSRTLGVLHGEIITLGKLVDDLHDLAKSDLGQLRYHFVPVDIGSVLLESVEGFSERLAAKAITVDSSALTDLHCVIEGDTTRLKQLFLNLLENSYRYTFEQGRVRVLASQTAGEVVINFDDSEPTVRGDSMERIFDRFFRGEVSRSRVHGGAGLGLPICKAIVEAHNGQISAAKSELGGLRVTIKFPVKGGEK